MSLKFVDEHPEIKETFYHMFKEKTRNEWYAKTCSEEFRYTKQFTPFQKQIKDIQVHDFGVYISIHYFLQDVADDDFCYEESLIVDISKIVPLYKWDSLCRITYKKLDVRQIDAENQSDTIAMMNLKSYIEEQMEKMHYIYINESEREDTVYEWSELDGDNFLTWGNRLTVDIASFYDVLNLLDDE